MKSFSHYLRELAVRRPEPQDTLGVPRKAMPQVAKDDYVELLQFLKGHGVTPKKLKVDPNELRAIQKDFKAAGVVKALELEKFKKAVLISNDMYVIDGNHRWLGALNSRATTIDALQFNTNGVRLLALVKKFSKTTYKGLYA